MPERMRGEKGDMGQTGLPGTTGETGETGLTGNRGSQGNQGNPGERGPTGDHGQDGAIGTTGKTGSTGTTGAKGHDGSNPRNRLLTMFIMQMVIFGILGWLIVQNTHKIDYNTLQQARINSIIKEKQDYLSCLNGVRILTQFNQFLVSMAKVEQDAINSGDDPNLTPARKARVRAYNRARIDIPYCSKPK